MGRAWNDAVALIKSNRQLVAILAGVFFFLPNAIYTLAAPQPTELMQVLQNAEQPDEELVLQLGSAWLGETWWMIAIFLAVTLVGMLGLLSLFVDRNRPTVGEAIAAGAKATLPYIAAQLIVFAINWALTLVLAGVGLLIHPALGALMLAGAFALTIYISVRMVLVAPIIVSDRTFNPLTALLQSLRMTSGNAVRLALFYILLFVAVFVLIAVVGLVFSVFELMGESIGLFANAIGGSLVWATLMTVLVAVVAAIYRQLADRDVDGETFA